MAILVVNAGSTSLKLHAVEADDTSVEIEALDQVAQGIEGVAHRVVHGGDRFREAVVIDDEVRRQIEEVVSLAPLHNAPALEALEQTQAVLPDVPHVAVFDTTFHRTMPAEAAAYALPREWRDQGGVRRYGFHGLSVEWCAQRVPEFLGRPPGRLVVCHLGGGSSVTAVRDGHSVDTTMGFSPLEGVPMTTRSGSVDPGAVLYLLRRRELDASSLDHVLNFDSGLAALAGGSGEMLDVEQQALSGDPDARLALDVFVLRVAGAIASMAASAGGIDALAFTAGIGEGSSTVRAETCARLAFLGVDLDSARNDAAEPDCDVATDDSPVRVLVVRAREELVAARAARALLGSDGDAA